MHGPASGPRPFSSPSVPRAAKNGIGRLRWCAPGCLRSETNRYLARPAEPLRVPRGSAIVGDPAVCEEPMPPFNPVGSAQGPSLVAIEALKTRIDETINSGRCRVDSDLPAHLDRCDTGDRHVTTALLLAAGAGTRLQPRTNGLPKCLTEVCGVPILGRLLSCLVEEGFERLVVVVGHRGEQIREYLDLHASGLEIHCIDCREFATTNNIYSLWLAREHIRTPFVLIESDLVFDSRLLGLMRVSNRIAVARYRPHMHGTTVSFDDSGRVVSFRVGAVNGARRTHKTVNLYSLSLPVWREVGRRLEERIASGRVHDYYEVVFADMAADGLLPFQAASFDDGRWCEIDTPDDLLTAEQLFSARRTWGHV